MVPPLLYFAGGKEAHMAKTNNTDSHSDIEGLFFDVTQHTTQKANSPCCLNSNAHDQSTARSQPTPIGCTFQQILADEDIEVLF